MMTLRVRSKQVPLKGMLLVGAAVLASGGAQAQDKPASTSNQSATVEQVVVTAERRTERAIDAPLSITALTTQDLAQAGVTSTEDLTRVVPGVSMPFNGGFLQPTIRGVSSAGSDAGDSSNVAMYVDGVYQPSQAGSLMNLPDVKQIEVLKGPQGTLYGQNAEGGAIIITTLAPSFTPTGMASVSYGNYNDVAVRGYVSGPLTDNLAASLSASLEDHDGYRKDIVYGGHDRGLRSELIRGKLLYTPTDRISITLSGFHSYRDDSSLYHGQPYKANSSGYYFIPTAPVATSWEQTSIGTGGFTKVRAYGAHVRGDIDFDFGTLTSITAYHHTRVHMLADVDYSPANFGDVEVNEVQRDWTEEVNFVSKKMWGATLTTGAFFLSGYEGFDPNTFTFHFPVTLAPAAPGPAIQSLTSLGGTKKKIAAGYAEISYDLTDDLVVTAGGRYSYEEQRSFMAATLGAPMLESPYSPATFEKFTPRVTARYALTPQSNVYASYSEGFKSGVLSVAAFGSPAVLPENLTAYEVGYKGQLLDNLMLDIAGYYYTYKNLQVARYVAPNYVYQNAASAIIKGIDMDATWAVTPELTLSAAASYLDAKYDSFKSAGAFLPSALTPGGCLVVYANCQTNINASGQPMIRAPEFTGSISADYRVETRLGEVGAFANVYYSDSYRLEVANRIRQSAYALVNANLSFSPAAYSQLRFVLWGKNLTNEGVIQSLLQTQIADGVSYGAPRTFGIRAEYQF